MGAHEELDWPLRVRVWDAALAAVRATLREAGLREVSTPVRVDAVAIEPWIDPLTSEGQLLITSPELAMKQLLARGSGPIFQVSHVFRRAERGDRHREEFHLIEWYREGTALELLMRDVERLVAAVFEAVGEVLGPQRRLAPQRWERVELLALMGETLGRTLAGDEPPQALAASLAHVRSLAGVGCPDDERPPVDGPLASLLAWTELFSLWSDTLFEDWLAARGREVGVHVVGFPAALAALAELEPDGRVGARFESHACGVELANCYRELRDGAEQRRRFELVAAMREHYGQARLPMPEAFIADVDRLPPCIGAALGLDRLLALACGQSRLDQVAIA